jgi:hypothetical protein
MGFGGDFSEAAWTEYWCLRLVWVGAEGPDMSLENEGKVGEALRLTNAQKERLLAKPAEACASGEAKLMARAESR